MRLFIEPSDVWLFRDGRPFDAGSDHRAASVFPPSPSVIQGALRAAYLALKGVRMDDYVASQVPEIEPIIGKAGEAPPFQLRGPFLGRRANGTIERYLPLPADVTLTEDGFCSLVPTHPAQQGVLTNLPEGLEYLLWQPSPDQSAKTKPRKQFAWANARAVLAYLQAESLVQARIALNDAQSDDEFFVRESRFGVGLDYAARRYQEHALYEAEFIRVQPNVGLDIEVEPLELPREGVLKLGGEGHWAHFEQVASLEMPSAKVGARFKMYFATPAYFDGGWKPRAGWSEFFASPAPRLVAVALPRYQVQGGYDLFRQAHKTARRFVPAGSVYYFVGEGAPQLLKPSVTHYGAEIGLGQVLLGNAHQLDNI
jgi:CRISPR-associated protein Cmr3